MQSAIKTAKMSEREAEKNGRSDNWVLRGSYHPAQENHGKYCPRTLCEWKSRKKVYVCVRGENWTHKEVEQKK